MIIVQTQGSCNIIAHNPRVVQDSYSDYSTDPMVVQYSAEPRVVQFYLTSTGKGDIGKLLQNIYIYIEKIS